MTSAPRENRQMSSPERVVATRAMALAAALAAIAACEQPELAIDCEQRGAVTGTIAPAVTGRAVAADLTVTGTAFHDLGRNIRRVTVAGIEAENEGVAFDRWTATVPIATLIALDADEDGEVVLAAEATDACRRAFDLGEAAVTIDRTPGIRVESLALSATLPNGEGYLPATGDVSALIRITANARAAGAAVTLAASSGSFSGLEGGAIALTGDGESAATATVFYASDAPGDALVTASADDHTTSVPIRVAGPPTFLPPGAQLAAGQTLAVTVVTAGRVHSCQASPSPALRATSAGQDLAVVPGGQDENGDGNVDIQIAAIAPIAQPAMVTVSCRDPFGQFSLATFTATP